MKPAVMKPANFVLVLCILALAIGLAEPIQAQPSVHPLDERASQASLEQALFLQKVSGRAAGSTTSHEIRLALQLTEQEIRELAESQGRIDVITLGDEKNPIQLHDDGRTGGDLIAGDGKYSALASLDDSELMARYEAETDWLRRYRDGLTMPRFDDRELVDVTNFEPFDLASFLTGEEVRLRPATIAIPGILLQIFQDNVLMIRDPVVVTDPTRTYDACNGTGAGLGPWSFGGLMTEMANQSLTGIAPADFVENWLDTWLTDQTINTFNVPARLPIQDLLDDWLAASGGSQLDLSIAPFRLLAILPRVDLRRRAGGGGGYSGGGSGAFLDAGEARFVFGMVAPASYPSNGTTLNGEDIPNTGGCKALEFAVIFEYGIPLSDCVDVRDWADQWRALNGLNLGSAAYKNALEALTDQFTLAGSNPAKPNGSALNQLRTNEIAFGFPWELRQFELTQSPGSQLQPVTTTDSMDNSFNLTQTFSDFVPPAGATSAPPVPLNFQGAPFLGGNSLVIGHPAPAIVWTGPGLIPGQVEERHMVALNVCSGCHRRETDTFFVHVSPSNGALPAELSDFMTGVSVPDPMNVTPVRTFDDLLRRHTDINNVANMLCGLVAVQHQIATPRLASPAPGAEKPRDAVIAFDDLVSSPIRQVH